MKKFLLELTEQEAEQLNQLAIEHGNKFKPFAEYLLRLQLGTVKPPTVQPIQIPVEWKPSADKPAKEDPRKAEPVKDMPRKNTAGKKREGEPTAKHKEGMFLQRKSQPIGTLSNGECLRRENPEGGHEYAYFKEDFKDYEEPF